MDTEEELNFAPEEPSAQAKILPIVVLSLLALTIGMTVYLFLDLRSTKAEFLAQTKQLKVHEEQIAQLEGSVNRAARTVDTSVKELKGVVASAEKSVAEAAQQVERRVLGRTNTLAQQIEDEKAARSRQTNRSGRRAGETLGGHLLHGQQTRLADRHRGRRQSGCRGNQGQA